MESNREVRYALRLPPDLHAAVVEMARCEDRSLNQQLIRLPREGVRRDEQQLIRLLREGVRRDEQRRRRQQAK